MKKYAMRQDSLLEVLMKHSMDVYHVEYTDYLFNHISHGIIALARLGADADRVQRFIDWYKPRLKTPRDQYDCEETRIADEQGYFRLLKHYRELLARHGSKEKLIQEEFPRLASGMVCAALHGLIHTGYTLAARWGQGVCEGLAYLSYAYKPLGFDVQADENNLKNFGKGNKQAADVVSAIGQDKRLRKDMLEGTDILRILATRNIGIIQFRLAILVTNLGDDIVRYANQLHIPALDIKAVNNIDIRKLGDWLVDQAIQLYVAADRRNDVHLIHTVTAAWSLRHLLPLFAPLFAVSCARIFVCVLLAVYLADDAPELVHSEEDMKDITDASWQPLLESILARDLDERIYLLVQVCYDMWKDNPGNPSSAWYLSAARLAEREPLRFCTFSRQ